MSGNGKSTFITIGASNHTDKEREEHDFYATDHVAIDRLVRNFELPKKLERINSLRKNEAKVKGESMKDSLYDLANYAILTIMELEKTEK